MIKQLAHVCLHSEDLEETERFYCQGLGMEIAFEFERRGERCGYYLKAGSRSFIEVFRGHPGQVGNINHLALEVEDMDGLLSRLKEMGIPAGPRKLGADASWQAWLEDPDGVRIELHEYTPESSQLTGRRCCLEE
jgi:catechol 2,3-dioxygenase-like lactoylglutathione lyase family enzyme